MKFDSLGNVIITETENKVLGLEKQNRPYPKFWYRFECRNCGNIWKARSSSDREKCWTKCKSLSVMLERFGNAKRGDSHQKASTSRKMSLKTTQFTIHLNNRMIAFIEAYNRDERYKTKTISDHPRTIRYLEKERVKFDNKDSFRECNP